MEPCFCVDVSCAEYEKLKLSTLPWYCPYVQRKYLFPDYPMENTSNIFLSRNPAHPSAQAVPSKKIDKHTNPTNIEILKKFKELYKLSNHTENVASCDYFDINEYKRARLFSFTFKHFIIISSYK